MKFWNLIKENKAFLIPFAFLMIIVYFGTDYQSKRYYSDFHYFDSSYISGKISYIDFGRKQSVFRIEGNENEFFVDTDERYILNETAEVGDSVFKDRYSDTLFLIKREKLVIPFTFYQDY